MEAMRLMDEANRDTVGRRESAEETFLMRVAVLPSATP